MNEEKKKKIVKLAFNYDDARNELTKKVEGDEKDERNDSE